jgi:hypothetical protein
MDAHIRDLRYFVAVARDDVVHRRVTGLPPAELGVVWRAGDDREAVGVFVAAAFQCLCA